MICQEFDGDIIVNSEWNKGTNFTILFALSDPSLIQNNEGMRILNKIQRKYAEIILPKEE